MEYKEVIKKRRSIRNFNATKIHKEHILEILESGTLAPSSHNSQPWLFYILQGNEKNKIADFMEEKIKSDLKYQMAMRTMEVIRQCDTLILVWNSESMNEKTIIESRFHEQSIGAAMENMCLTATDLGIGSLWIGLTYIVEEEIKKYFQVADMHLSCALALGYSDLEPSMRPRKKLEDIVIWKGSEQK